MNEYFSKKYDIYFGKYTLKDILNTAKQHSRDEFIRINTSKQSREEIIAWLKKERVKFNDTPLKNALKINKSFFSLASAPTTLSGHIYLQDIASQLPVEVVKPFLKDYKKVRILDMCASPGSKTTQLADVVTSLSLPYEITALEPNEKRVLRLMNNIQKQNFRNICVIKEFAEKFKSKEQFDIILLDAPCSGNVFSEKNWLKKRDKKGIVANAQLQKQLLSNAVKLLSKNGIIVYSTCSLEIEENEENIVWAVKQLHLKTITSQLKLPYETDSIKLIKEPQLKKKLVDNRIYSLRLMPNISKTQGFYVCILKFCK